MKICLSHNSALAYWRYTRADESAGKPGKPSHYPGRSYGCSPQMIADAHLGLFGVNPTADQPLHVFVSKRNQKHLGQANCHCSTRALPLGSFTYVTEHLDVVCPELCFLQMSRSLSLPQSIQLGFEMCGTYSLTRIPSEQGKNKDTVDFTSPHAPLTTPERLVRYLSSTPQRHGTKNALRAAKCLIGGAASPRETALAMILSLPSSIGGLGDRNILLNQKIRLSAKAEKIARKKTCRPDVLLTGTNIIIEYDSSAFHQGSAKWEEDTRRRNALEVDGYQVTVITNDQFCDFSTLQAVLCKQIQKSGRRVRPRRANYESLQRELHKELRFTDRQLQLF